MGNSPSSAVGLMAVKQQLGGIVGDAKDQPKPAQAPAARKNIEQQRKERDEEFERKKADRQSTKGKLSQKWAENKARER
jgi:hypothetical protein